MKDGEVEEKDRDIIGKLMVRRGNEHQEPCVVWVRGISANFSDDDRPTYNCEIINTETMVFADRLDLKLFIDNKTVKLEVYLWRLQDIARKEKRLNELIEEINRTGK